MRLRCSPKCTSLVNLAREKHQFSLLAKTLRLPAKGVILQRKGRGFRRGFRFLFCDSGFGWRFGPRGRVAAHLMHMHSFKFCLNSGSELMLLMAWIIINIWGVLIFSGIFYNFTGSLSAIKLR